MTSVRGHICVRRKAKDGAEGAAGKSIRNSVWESGKQYYAGDTPVDGVYPLDIVSDKAMAIGTSGVNFYMCVKTHVSPNTSNLTNTTYWKKLNTLQPVVTYLILAELIKASFIDVDDLAANSAFIQNLIASTIFTSTLSANSAFLDNLVAKRIRSATSGKRVLIEGNMLTMYDANDVLKLLVSGEDLSSVQGSTTVSFTPGTILSAGIAASPNFNHGVTYSGTGNSGSITLASSCLLNLPSVTVPGTFYCDGLLGGEVNGRLTVYWLVDGQRIGNSADNNNTVSYLEGGASKDITVIMPAQSVSVGAGTHTIALGCDISFYGEDYIADSGTFSYSAGCNNSVTVQSEYPVQKTEVAGNGFRVMFTSNHFMEAVKTGNASSTITFTLRAGSYALRVSEAGVQKTSDGGSTWSNL